jgi:hypothetical protein
MKQHPGVELLMDVTNKNKVESLVIMKSICASIILPTTVKIEKMDLSKTSYS